YEYPPIKKDQVVAIRQLIDGSKYMELHEKLSGKQLKNKNENLALFQKTAKEYSGVETGPSLLNRPAPIGTLEAVNNDYEVKWLATQIMQLRARLLQAGQSELFDSTQVLIPDKTR